MVLIMELPFSENEARAPLTPTDFFAVSLARQING